MSHFRTDLSTNQSNALRSTSKLQSVLREYHPNNNILKIGLNVIFYLMYTQLFESVPICLANGCLSDVGMPVADLTSSGCQSANRDSPLARRRIEKQTSEKRSRSDHSTPLARRPSELLYEEDKDEFGCIKARLQTFTVLFSLSAILVCFIDAQIHSCFREKMSEFERQ